MMKSLNILNSKNYKIKKPIRLIELFAGYGSQHFALKYLGKEVESWRICEWAVKSIQAYKDAHFSDDNNDYSKGLDIDFIYNVLYERGISRDYNKPMTPEQIKRMGEEKARTIYNNIVATHNLVNIQKTTAKSLDIVDRDKYEYIMTYSFPCQDLSLAGLGKGMSRDSGTRSGMLWEVERILEECNGELPQVLLMENVPQVHGKKNLDNFIEWQQKLESLGYTNYWKDLNAKEYGIPQNRNRTFMISLLNKGNYTFPEKKELVLHLKDLLEKNVEESYYLSDNKIHSISKWKAQQKPFEHVLGNNSICPTLTARGAGEEHSGMITYSSDFETNTNIQKELEPIACASRGRNPENPNSRKSGEYLEQRIEINTSGCSNCLTTVQKDNYVIEPNSFTSLQEQMITDDGNIKRYINSDIIDKFEPGDCADISYPNGYGKGNRVTKQCAPTITSTTSKSNLIIKETNNSTLQRKIYNKILESGLVKVGDMLDYTYSNARLKELKKNKITIRNRKNNTLSCALTTLSNNIGLVVDDTPNDNINVVANNKPSNHSCGRIISTNGITPTVMENHGEVIKIIEPNTSNLKSQLCNKLIENGLIEENSVIRHSYTNNRLNNGVKNMIRTESKEKICPTLDTRCDCLGICVNDKYSLNKKITYKTHPTNKHISNLLDDIKNYRIRKLTPKECFRLMGVRDEDYERIAINQSNASLYHLAGDSIVVNVLMKIFEKLF